MPEKKRDGNRKAMIAGAVVVVVLVAAMVTVFVKKAETPATAPEAAQKTDGKNNKEVRVPVKEQPLIEFNSEEKSSRDLMAKRKAEYGLDKGVDIIARSDESVKIGNRVISMQDIADKIRLEKGKILEKDIATGKDRQGVQTFGIYVVQPGDNIWNIHFRFLKEYFQNRGVRLSPLADEPDRQGFSSGVGKLLKFSENLVYIYNIEENKLTPDLNLIYPMSKIVVYNMDRVYALLDSIDTDQIKEIRFDGENLWIPAS